MNELHLLEKLEAAALSPQQQDRLFALITAVFGRAIDVRSPKNRPPGKAGLRAEKGYYRLLFLEGELQEKIPSSSGTSAYDWDFIPVILGKLKDIPELQTEIMEGIEASLAALTSPAAEQ